MSIVDILDLYDEKKQKKFEMILKFYSRSYSFYSIFTDYKIELIKITDWNKDLNTYPL